MKPSQWKRQGVSDLFMGATVILSDGTEVPLTEDMIQQACQALSDDRFYPPTSKDETDSPNQN